ncbi:hypothetical protein CDO52_11670 [Nocardiopsis gilva YIM 90087]|uniref:Uncharacterized protein n=2 Tax=Nocardiopsis gilva TaxID=280236 RepID=A0A223S5I8_9ACTN|nr:hypothetical protein CDO52_11670 [Nocardiopsis gilva YIM 90087]
MALRGKAMWFAVLPFALISLLLLLRPVTAVVPAQEKAGKIVLMLVFLVPVGVGVAMADRFRRTRGSGIEELLASTPLAGPRRLLGVLFGGAAVASAPGLVISLGSGVYIAIADGAPSAPLWSVVAFAVLLLPACLWSGALTATLGLVLPVPVVRVLVAPLWLWFNWWNYTLRWVPTPTGTVLTPIGEYPGAAWFGVDTTWAGYGQVALLSPPTGPVPALVNLACVLGAVALFVWAARLIIDWKG